MDGTPDTEIGARSSIPSSGFAHFALGVPDNAVTTTNIQDSAVTSAKIAAGSVNGSKIVDGSIGASHVDSTQVQRRVIESCDVGNAIRVINDIGGVICQPTGGGGGIGGSGTANFIPKFTAATILGNSAISEVGGNVGIGTSSPDQQLTVNGAADLWGTSRAFFYRDSGVTLQGYVGHGLNSDLTLVSKRAGDWLRIGSNPFGSTLTPIAFWANGNADVDNSPQMVFQSWHSGITSNGLNPGLLGLGTTAPATPIHVLINTASAGATAWQDGDAITSECFPTANPPLTNLCRAIYARANSTATSQGLGYGVHAVGSGAQSYALYAEAINGARFAGTFIGDVNIFGRLFKSAGSFKIDHPLDPANKYLYHSFVESPDMMNIYNGNVILDANGEAWVELPHYFQTLNKDFRYLLTSIGAPGPNLYIAKEVEGNRFQIAGGKPGMKVSWQVTGIRQDAYAEAHRIKVEEEKPESEQGYYLYPELYGQPQTKSIQWAHDPEGMKRMVEERGKVKSSDARTASLP